MNWHRPYGLLIGIKITVTLKDHLTPTRAISAIGKLLVTLNGYSCAQIIV